MKEEAEIWDRQVDFYGQLSEMEKPFSIAQVDCLPFAPTDTVLDVGCGTGRLTTVLSGLVSRVTALDISPRMLEKCRENVDAIGAENVDYVLMDWDTVEVDKTMHKHDMVISSRSAGQNDFEKLSSLTNKYAVSIVFSNDSPRIPTIASWLFKGTSKEVDPNFPVSPNPSGVKKRYADERRFSAVAALGYQPHLEVVTDGFTAVYAGRAEAYEDLSHLRPPLSDAERLLFQSNVDKYLQDERDGKVRFFCGSKTCVLWWDVRER